MNISVILLAAAICVAACHAARNAALSTTTSTVPPKLPTVSMEPRSPYPDTVTLLPIPTCPDDNMTTSPLARLRRAMKDVSYTQMNAFFDAFLVFYSDEHLSDEPAAEERRLEYVSGWDGAGTAAVLADGGPAAVWVPSGDVRRARSMLSCAWLVLDADDVTQPGIADWISGRLGRSGRVGADARLTSVDEWQHLSSELQRLGLQLIHTPALLDQLWNDEQDHSRKRPEFSRVVANLHPAEYTGLSWRDKLSAVRSAIRENGADAMIITALDEVAWLLNVRGRDVPYAPLLKAFVVVSTRDLRIYVPPGKLALPVREALAVCYVSSSNCTRVSDYVNIYSDLRRAPESKIIIPTGGTFHRGASAAIAQSVPVGKRVSVESPIMYMKAQKNPAEVKGMRTAHLRDAVAMCTMLSYVEGMVKVGLNEVSLAMKVDLTRATQAGYIGLSMKTRVSFGPSAADPNHLATVHTSRRIYKNSTVVIQSGGQYEEGTTVVTRTMHYGEPTREERRAYTRTLQAAGALSLLQAPGALPAAHADPVARAPLWAAAQDYPHPTGHGVGAALSRREDPVVVDYRHNVNLHTLQEGYFITSEPAWYEANKFGVRLGNILEVVAKPNGYLGFQEATLVPYEPKLIDVSLLTEYELNWLNAYNKRIRELVGPELKELGLLDVYYWMMRKTMPLEIPSKVKEPKSNSAHRSTDIVAIVLSTTVAIILAL